VPGVVERLPARSRLQQALLTQYRDEQFRPGSPISTVIMIVTGGQRAGDWARE
jgi:hypothetical protein